MHHQHAVARDQLLSQRLLRSVSRRAAGRRDRYGRISSNLCAARQLLPAIWWRAMTEGADMRSSLRRTWGWCSLAVCLMPACALAWTSGPESEDTSGPVEARNTWGWDPAAEAVVPANEHARLLFEAMIRAGIPSSLNPVPNTAFDLTVYPVIGTVPSAGVSSVLPGSFSGFGSANTKATRHYTIAGFAGLPDHSYSLADWVAGNEKCPPGTVLSSET